MSEDQLVETTPQKQFMSAASRGNKKRIAETEKEIEDLIKSQSPEEVEEGEEVEQEVNPPPEERQQEDEGLSAEEKTFKKRYGDLRRHMQQKEQEWKEEFEKVQNQLKEVSQKSMALPKTEEEVNAWIKKYPDVAAIVESIADKKAKERSTQLDSRLKEIESLGEQVSREKAEAKLREYHPDFDKIRDDDAFHEWAETQPRWIQDALYNDPDVEGAARAIDLYKADKGIKKAKKSSPNKDAALSVNARNRAQPQEEDTPAFSESQVRKMGIHEYSENEEAIMKAMRDGKFKYDVSGGAR